jgi:hypothetical protein
MFQFSTMMFIAGAAVLLTTLLVVDGVSLPDCFKDSHDVSLYKNAVSRNVVLN